MEQSAEMMASSPDGQQAEPMAQASSGQDAAVSAAPTAQQQAPVSPAMAPPAQAPAPLYPQYLNQQPQPVVNQTSQAIAAGVMGLIVVGTGTMGANLHKVNDGEMSFNAALTESVAKGTAGAAAAAGASYASSTLTTGGLFGLAVTIAAGTGISYLLTK